MPRSPILLLITSLFISAPSEARPRMELKAAVAAKIVTVKAQGSGIDAVRLTLTARSSIKVSIPAGTLFDTPKNAAHQRMVVTKGKEVTLEPGFTRRVKVDTACANYYRSIPAPRDTFVLGEASPKLLRLVRCLEQKRVGDHERQVAIWRLTDNINHRALELRPQMVDPLLIKRCAKRMNRATCEKMIKKGAAKMRKKLAEKAPKLIHECEGFRVKERKRERLRRLFKK